MAYQPTIIGIADTAHYLVGVPMLKTIPHLLHSLQKVAACALLPK